MGACDLHVLFGRNPLQGPFRWMPPGAEVEESRLMRDDAKDGDAGAWVDVTHGQSKDLGQINVDSGSLDYK